QLQSNETFATRLSEQSPSQVRVLRQMLLICSGGARPRLERLFIAALRHGGAGKIAVDGGAPEPVFRLLKSISRFAKEFQAAAELLLLYVERTFDAIENCCQSRSTLACFLNVSQGE